MVESPKGLSSRKLPEYGIAPKADILMPAGSYLVLLWLLEQVRFAVNKDIISFEEHVTWGWRASESNGAILSVEISRGFVRRSLHVDFSTITSLEKIYIPFLLHKDQWKVRIFALGLSLFHRCRNVLRKHVASTERKYVSPTCKGHFPRVNNFYYMRYNGLSMVFVLLLYYSIAHGSTEIKAPLLLFLFKF